MAASDSGCTSAIFFHASPALNPVPNNLNKPQTIGNKAF